MASLNLSDLRKISKKFLKKPEPRGCGLLTEAPNVYPDAADRGKRVPEQHNGESQQGEEFQGRKVRIP